MNNRCFMDRALIGLDSNGGDRSTRNTTTCGTPAQTDAWRVPLAEVSPMNAFLFQSTSRIFSGLERPVLAALAGGVCVGLAYWNWYAPYTAITFHRDRLELHYLWPRSSEFTLPKDIVSMNILLSGQVRGEGGSDTFYALEITTSGGRHESMAIGSQEPVLAVKERIMRMGK